MSVSPLARTVALGTDIWNDSCSTLDLAYAIAHGATGATANPTIVHDVWRAESATWSSRAAELALAHPSWSERELAWGVVAVMSSVAARLLEPAFDASGGRKGRLSVQTDPTLFRDASAMVDQAVGFADIAPNIIVKFPSTGAGIAAMEEATYRGISVNATVSFTVAQAIAAGEAIERGMERRAAAGLTCDSMGPVVTVMMGRLEDWLRVLEERDGIVADPVAVAWSGVAVFKRAYREFRARRFRSRLLGAAIRHRLHWTALVGGDCAITLPAVWQRRFNASGIEVRPTMDEPVAPALIDELCARFPDFVRAYEPGALTADQFVDYGASVRTLRAFTASYHALLAEMTQVLLPETDRVR